jgi:hypothetical protein
MARVSVLTWIGNAAAVLLGRRGAVTAQAQQAGCSRQTAYDHAQRVQQAVTDLHAGGPSRDELLQQCQQLREENRQLWQALEPTIDFPQAKQRQFAAVAAALGLSLPQTRTLLAIVLSAARCPSRATLGRWVQQAAARASSVVECMNSVVRMHQARHRRLTQPILDWKRLYWNCRDFAAGKRRGQCPYEHLGLRLPTYDAWTLLQMDPEEVAQQLSTVPLAA